ncbi:MAG: hypothetical protein KC425_12365 [Anaerolineales bacterium]|nr:hypothetical protein [Anaerolineales bacterium]
MLRAEAPGLAMEAAAAEDDTLTGEPDDVSRTIDIVEAEGQLGELLTMALQGVDVILARDEAPLVRLVPAAPAAGRPRVAGLHPDAMQTSADFDAPFPDAFWLGET